MSPELRLLVLLALVLPPACSGTPPQARAPTAAETPLQPPAPANGQLQPGRSEHERDVAVLDGMRWLVRHQNPDGSWGAASFGQHCTPEGACLRAGSNPRDHYDVGLTGLALLAFLRAGYTQESKQDIVDTTRGVRHKLSDVVGGGLAWLRARQQPDGSFSTERAFLYNEAIATLAICEASRLTHDADLAGAAQHAVDFVQAAQRPSPTGQGLWGWRYSPRTEIEKSGRGDDRELFDSDTSATSWCALALDSARRAGLAVRQEWL